MRVRAWAMIMAAIVIMGLIPGAATAAPTVAHLDPAFGGDGIVETNGALGVATQPNGKVLARSSDGTTRYSATGAPPTPRRIRLPSLHSKTQRGFRSFAREGKASGSTTQHCRCAPH